MKFSIETIHTLSRDQFKHDAGVFGIREDLLGTVVDGKTIGDNSLVKIPYRTDFLTGHILPKDKGVCFDGYRRIDIQQETEEESEAVKGITFQLETEEEIKLFFDALGANPLKSLMDHCTDAGHDFDLVSGFVDQLRDGVIAKLKEQKRNPAHYVRLNAPGLKQY